MVAKYEVGAEGDAVEKQYTGSLGCWKFPVSPEVNGA